MNIYLYNADQAQNHQHAKQFDIKMFQNEMSEKN